MTITSTLPITLWRSPLSDPSNHEQVLELESLDHAAEFVRSEGDNATYQYLITKRVMQVGQSITGGNPSNLPTHRWNASADAWEAIELED